ncbi:MAG: nitroreductase family protein [Nakamurella sp.]
MTAGLTGAQLTRVLEAGCRAPSLHNSQPWAFVTGEDRIEVHIDRQRLLPAADPDLRETRIGCGAVVLDLRLALMRYGVHAAVTILPDGETGPLATLRLTPGAVHSAEFAQVVALEQAISDRRTNRRPFLSVDVPPGHQHQLCQAADTEHAVLHLLTDPATVAEVRRLSVVAHRTQRQNPAWQAEWDAWTRRVGTADGVPLDAAGPSPAPQDPWTLRDFGAADRPERLAGRDFEDQPLIAVLATAEDLPRSHINAGQALQRVLLTGTSLGLSASFVSQLIEVPSARRSLRALTDGRNHPQAVLRIGFGEPTSPTPRRDVADCLIQPFHPSGGLRVTP